MATLQSQIFSSVYSDIISIDEYNEESLDLQKSINLNGLYISPSRSVPGRQDITGYVLTATNSEGKVEWKKSGGGNVQGNGSIWFSDSSGLPSGDPDELYWDDTLKRMAIGHKNPETSLDVRGTIQSQYISLYDQTNIINKILLNAPLLSSSYTFTLPPTSGLPSQVLVTDGNGITNWETQSASPNVQGQHRIWYSNSNGNPIGNPNLTFDGNILTVIGDITSSDLSGSTITLRSGLFTNTIDAGVLSSNLNLTLPITSGSSGQVLQTNGSGVLSWATVGSTPPSGSQGDVQYKNGSSFNGSSVMNFDGTVLRITNVTDNGKLSSDLLDVGTASQFTVDSTGSVNCILIATEDIVLVNGGNTTSIVSSPSQNLQSLTITLPTNSGLSNQFLQTDGFGVTTWATPILSAGGNDTEVQFNNAGLLEGSSDFTYDGTSFKVGNVNIDKTTGIVTATKYLATSDQRLKENIEPLDTCIDYLYNINAYSYNFKNSDQVTYGLIAQELESIQCLKHLVIDGKDGYKSVDYIQLIPLLINKLNDLDNEVRNLKQQWN